MPKPRRQRLETEMRPRRSKKRLETETFETETTTLAVSNLLSAQSDKYTSIFRQFSKNIFQNVPAAISRL